ncbi:MAG: helix-turn-helix domain-containing protein [Acidobacteriota bacterium]
MLYHTYIPKPPLSDFVELFWLYEGYQPSHKLERILPTGTMELVINLREDQLKIYDQEDHHQFQSLRSSLISGVHSEFFVIDTASQASVIGIHFKPGGSFPFLGLPANELHNVTISLDTIWGKKADELREQLLTATTPKLKFSLLERYLLAQATQPLVRHPAVAFALETILGGKPVDAISYITTQIGLSPRRFIELFSTQVGLTPKLFCRIQRFQEVIRLIDRQEKIEWVELALACGYFDQAHFIRDFRTFSGLNPTAYLIQRNDRLNHVPLAS